MSNLSELLPAGAGAKSASFVASGTLGSGVTVVLKTDGTVEAVAETSVSRSIGSSTAVSSERSLYFSGISLGDNRIAINAKGITDNQSTVVIGTVSGTSISFGSELVYREDSATNRMSGLAYDTVNNILTLAHPAGTNLVGNSFSVSGDALTDLGSASLRTSWSFQTDVVEGFFAPEIGSSYFLYSGSSGLYWSKATYSGGSVSWSSGTFNTTNSWKFAGGLSYDPALEQVLINCSLQSNSSGYVLIGYFNSGTLTYNAAYQYSSGGLNAGSTHETSACHIPNTNSHIFTWKGSFSLSDYAYAQIIEWDGSTIDASNTRYTIASSAITQSSVSWNASANKAYALVTYSSPASNHGIEMTVSGSAITVDANDTINSDTANQYGLFSSYCSTVNANVVGYLANGSNLYRTANVVRLAYPETNSADFIGITDQAIADTATGAVIVQGGVITNTGLIPYTGSSGSPVTYMSTGGFYSSLSYDTNANKIVVANRKDSPSNYGVAFVGTVSGTSISFGAEATFNAANSDNISSVFDSNSNKVVIAYSDVGNSSHGTVVVGTVSGTTISFGTAVVFEAAAVQGISIAFDSTNNKVVIFYEDDANSDYGTAIVGTVSGTSISFGTPVVFDSVNMQITGGEAAVYDSANNRAVVFYRNASGFEGYAAVGTVSGTSISFGTPVKFSSGAAELNYISATFDSAANKIVTSYRVNNDSGYGKAIVGTVSGTSISFGLESTFESASTNFTSSTFNSTLNQVVISYSDAGNSNYGTFVIATVNGTNISFSTPAVFSSTTAAQYIATTFDSDTNNLVSSYADSAASYHPKSVVTSFLNDLTIGTDYFVQSDGTLSTTTSTVPAGRALSSTSILLEG